MKIGLIGDNINFPSLPLMKISSYHKTKGDNVKLIDNYIEHFDLAYVSKTFNLSIKKIKKVEQLPIQADKIIYGGTGFAIEVINGKEIYKKEKDKNLPNEIEHIYPDYSLYPEYTKNTAYGFLTRGCCNNCDFCIVSQKEGKCSKQVAELSEFWRGQKNIKLMDGNILACQDREQLLQQLINSKAGIDYTQGLDARFIDKHIAKMICQTRIKMIHFAFDFMKNEKSIIRGLKIFNENTELSDRYKKVYILTNYNTTLEEDYYRVKKVTELGYQPDIRIYQKGTQPRFLTDLARWANNSFIYRSCNFEDYVPRTDGKRIKDIYNYSFLH